MNLSRWLCPKAVIMLCVTARMLSCVSTAPLGNPVVPEQTALKSSSSRLLQRLVRASCLDKPLIIPPIKVEQGNLRRFRLHGLQSRQEQILGENEFR